MRIDVAPERLEPGQRPPRPLRGRDRAPQLDAARGARSFIAGSGRPSASGAAAARGRWCARRAGRRRGRDVVALVVLLVVAARRAAAALNLRDDGAEDPGVAALVEAGIEPSRVKPRRVQVAHLVALDQREDLLDALALGGGDDEAALGDGGPGAEVDDPEGRCRRLTRRQSETVSFWKRSSSTPLFAVDDQVLRCHTHLALGADVTLRALLHCRICRLHCNNAMRS